MPKHKSLNQQIPIESGALSAQAECDRVLRFDEVHMKTGLCRAHVHALAAEGRFPKPLKLVPGGRASGWLLSEINQWIVDRAAERDNGPFAA